jgi:hypothetical protein
MSWSTNTVCKNPSLYYLLVAFFLGSLVYGQEGEVRVPTSAVAGNAASIGVAGGGSGTFYLVGPTISIKRDVKSGEDIQLSGKDLRAAGRYLAIVCSDSCRSAEFFVSPAKPADLTFIVHPSRAPVGQNDSISGVAFPVDEFQNLVVAPTKVDFQLSANGKELGSHPTSTENGVAWFRAGSGKTAGPLQIAATLGDVSARRIVQRVASEPCNLRIKGEHSTKGIVVETDPVRDCAGNPVPDGTIVTFTAKNGAGTDTVDAPVKKGIARAQLTSKGPLTVSAASGVVMGNELRVE